MSLLVLGFRTSIVWEDTPIVPLRTPLVLLATLLVAVVWGCTTNSAATLPDADFFVLTGQRFGLRVGDTAGVQTTNAIALVRFAAVSADSRCPETVTCVDAGFVTLELTVQSALAVTDVQVQVPPGADLNVSVEVEELTVNVHEVQPMAQDGVVIDILEYAALMSVVETGNIGL